jgi:hypothetical protein
MLQGAIALPLGLYAETQAALNGDESRATYLSGQLVVGFSVVVVTAVAGSGGAPDVFEGYESGQGFSGVFDITTEQVALRPSTYADPVPDGYVAARGGHAEVSEELGGDPDNHNGFAAILQDDGSVNLTWRSRTLNRTPDALVPPALRPQITQAVQARTCRVVKP